jgi:sugar/nucleoside kinase (ribokinase family)
MKIASVGETTIDVYTDLEQEYVGGISLNFAVQSKRCGAEEVSLVSCIGANQSARILAKLDQERVDASHVGIAAGATASQRIELDRDGERIFPPGGYDPGVLAEWWPDDSDLHFLQSRDVLVSACFLQVEPLFRQVMDLSFDGWRIADFLDLSDYDRDIRLIEQQIDRLTIAFVSGDEKMVEKLRNVSRKRATLIVVTLGSKGSVAITDGITLHEPAVQVDRCIDSTGCGDAFQAAFTVSYWRERNIQRALEAGAHQAAKAIQHFGATGS